MKNLIWNPGEVSDRCWIVVLAVDGVRGLINNEEANPYISGYAIL